MPYSFEIPFLPPTSNNCYVSRRGQPGRFLSEEARAFKENAISHLSTSYLSEMADIGLLPDDQVLMVTYCLYLPPEDVLNATYGNGKKSAAKSRYKKMDLDNRLKLVGDAVFKSIGRDDSLIMGLGAYKLSNTLVGGISKVLVLMDTSEASLFGF